MSRGDNSPGLSKLAGVIRQVAEKGKDKSLVLDFGTIQEDYSLLTNTYPIPIPLNDYLVCRGVALPNSEIIDSEETTATNKAHSHGYAEQTTVTGRTGTSEGHSHSYNISLAPVRTATATSQQNPHPHRVDIARPSQRMFAPGDRVLVAWVQNDAVVIDIIFQAASILEGGG